MVQNLTLRLHAAKGLTDGDREGTLDAMAGVEPRSRATTDQYGLVKLAKAGQKGAGLAIQANDARLAGTGPHAATHKNGGSDAIKLDELADPTNNTNGDATTARHGLMSKADKVKLDGMTSGGAFSVQATVPANSFGANGDACMVLANHTLYFKAAGTWQKFGHVSTNVTNNGADFDTPSAGTGTATLDTP